MNLEMGEHKRKRERSLYLCVSVFHAKSLKRCWYLKCLRLKVWETFRISEIPNTTFKKKILRSRRCATADVFALVGGGDTIIPPGVLYILAWQGRTHLVYRCQDQKTGGRNQSRRERVSGTRSEQVSCAQEERGEFSTHTLGFLFLFCILYPTLAPLLD